MECQPSGRIILRTAFFDNGRAVSKWIKEGGFKVLSPEQSSASQSLDNRRTLTSIRVSIREAIENINALEKSSQEMPVATGRHGIEYRRDKRGARKGHVVSALSGKYKIKNGGPRKTSAGRHF